MLSSSSCSTPSRLKGNWRTFRSAAARPAALPVRSAPADASTGQRVMPDLRGLSARRALEALGPLRLGVRLEGDGFVTSHRPGPGEPVGHGAVAALNLERRPGQARGNAQ